MKKKEIVCGLLPSVASLFAVVDAPCRWGFCFLKVVGTMCCRFVSRNKTAPRRHCRTVVIVAYCCCLVVVGIFL
jgi:hypothetical protein